MSSIEQGLTWDGINYHPDDSSGADNSLVTEYPQEEQQEKQIILTENPRKISRRQFLRKSLYAATGLAALATVIAERTPSEPPAEAAFGIPPDPDRQPDGPPGTIPERPKTLDEEYWLPTRPSAQLDGSALFHEQFEFTGNGTGTIAIMDKPCPTIDILEPVWDKIEWFKNGVKLNQAPQPTEQHIFDSNHLLFPLQEFLILRTPNIARVMVDVALGYDYPDYERVFNNFADQGADVIVSIWGHGREANWRGIFEDTLDRRNCIIVQGTGNDGPVPNSAVGELWENPDDPDPRIIGVGSLYPYYYKNFGAVIPRLDSGRGGNDVLTQPRVMQMGGIYRNKDNNYEGGERTSVVAPVLGANIAAVMAKYPGFPAWELGRAVCPTATAIPLSDLRQYPNEDVSQEVPLDGVVEGTLFGVPHNTLTGCGHMNMPALFAEIERLANPGSSQIYKSNLNMVFGR